MAKIADHDIRRTFLGFGACFFLALGFRFGVVGDIEPPINCQTVPEWLRDKLAATIGG